MTDARDFAVKVKDLLKPYCRSALGYVMNGIKSDTSKGKICGTVNMSGWKSSHYETVDIDFGTVWKIVVAELESKGFKSDHYRSNNGYYMISWSVEKVFDEKLKENDGV